MSVHVIRLRGHWTRTELSDGRIRYARHFGHPRTLDTDESVWLTCSLPPGDGTAQLNDRSLGSIRTCEPFAFDATALLALRNVIVLEVDSDSEVWDGEVAMEIIKGDSQDSHHCRG